MRDTAIIDTAVERAASAALGEVAALLTLDQRHVGRIGGGQDVGQLLAPQVANDEFAANVAAGTGVDPAIGEDLHTGEELDTGANFRQ